MAARDEAEGNEAEGNEGQGDVLAAKVERLLELMLLQDLVAARLHRLGFVYLSGGYGSLINVWHHSRATPSVDVPFS